MNAIVSPAELEHHPLEIDSRPCELCGLTIDRHEMVDEGEGPIFYCLDLSLDEMTLDELERRAHLRREEEIAAIIADMEAADHLAPIRPLSQPQPYHTPESTVRAFWHVVGLGDGEYLARWLARHPLDASELLKIWEKKC